MQFQCDFSPKPNVSVLNIQLHSDDHEPQPFWRVFEYRLNTVWMGLAAEALFWAYIYYIMNGCRYIHTHALCAYEGTKKGASLPQSWRSMSRSLFPRLRGVFWCIWHLSGVPVQGMVNAGQTHVPVLSIQSWEKSPQNTSKITILRHLVFIAHSCQNLSNPFIYKASGIYIKGDTKRRLVLAPIQDFLKKISLCSHKRIFFAEKLVVCTLVRT